MIQEPYPDWQATGTLLPWYRRLWLRFYYRYFWRPHLRATVSRDPEKLARFRRWL